MDQIYRDATDAEVGEFLSSPIIALTEDYDAGKGSKPNRKRLSMVMDQVAAMDDATRLTYIFYTQRYCPDLVISGTGTSFEMGADTDLRVLIYELSERFYDTEMAHKRRLAKSVQVL